ncbi:MAG: hypothetical protein SGPRY_004617 [Prymnesium sp.]
MAQDIYQSAQCLCAPLEREGYHYSAFLSYLLWECIYSPMDALAVALGFMNIFFWAVSQLPQLYQNYVHGNCQGLSLLFLLCWAVADAASLLGCMLTQQPIYMTFTSGYFCTSDAILLSQFAYYSWRSRTTMPEDRLKLHTHLLSPTAQRLSEKQLFAFIIEAQCQDSDSNRHLWALRAFSSCCIMSKRSRGELDNLAVSTPGDDVAEMKDAPLCDGSIALPPWAMPIGTMLACIPSLFASACFELVQSEAQFHLRLHEHQSREGCHTFVDSFALPSC